MAARDFHQWLQAAAWRKTRHGMSISPRAQPLSTSCCRLRRKMLTLPSFYILRQYAALSPEDHGLATQIAMACCAGARSSTPYLHPCSKWPLEKLDVEVLTSLRMGAYQLTRLERVPTHAVVHESVELVKRSRRTSAAGLVNALLRKVGGTAGVRRSGSGSSAAKAFRARPQPIAAEYAHPEWLAARWLGSLRRGDCEGDLR